MTGSEFKPVNLFDGALVNEKQPGNKNIININIIGCLSQNAISTGVYFKSDTVAYKGVAYKKKSCSAIYTPRLKSV